MNKRILILITSLFIIASSCKNISKEEINAVRSVVDTIGFAQYDWQMDSIVNRLDYQNELDNKWRVAISPHDDYAYVGNLYPRILNGIKAKTIILFGVAHKARNYDLENKIIFDSFNAWSAPYGNVKVSELRDQIISKLPDDLYVVHNEMQSVEHSLEALIPFLQFRNKELEIVPILVPYMSYDKMQEIAEPLAKVLAGIMKKNNLNWGSDVAIIISTDAVHYGDEDWGGKNYAPFGTDSTGLIGVKNQEMEIINNCLIGEVTLPKVQRFINYTVQETDYKEYKWTWCGRYSVPFGLLTAYQLNKIQGKSILKGNLIGYSTSIDHPKIKVEDINMGTTAPANNHHFVGYAAVGYE